MTFNTRVKRTVKGRDKVNIPFVHLVRPTEEFCSKLQFNGNVTIT